MKIRLNFGPSRCIFANTLAKLTLMTYPFGIKTLLLVGALAGWVAPLGAQTQVGASDRANAGGVSFELGPWKAYLVNEITPSWSRMTPANPVAVSWVGLDQFALAPSFAHQWLSPSVMSSRSSLMGATSLWADFERRSLARMSSTLVDAQRTRIEQSLMMSGLTTQFSEQAAWTVSAVLATQRFVNPGMNLLAYQGAIPATPKSIWHDGEPLETSHGLGVRVAGEFQPWNAVKIETSFRSRIDMNPLATLQGVHGAQAQLDIPSQFETALSVDLTDRVAGFVGVSRIFYSEVGAFPSRAMPARFSALLGDSTSPEFTWRDLTVFSAGVDVQLTERLSASIEYKNRAQPRPTSKALADALGSALGKHAWRVGLTQWLSSNMNFHLGAAYAPPEYVFGGHILGVVSDELNHGLEAQAIWQLWF